MRVFLAGRVAVESGEAVTDERRFPGRQGRLLFAYLATEEARAVPRDELAEALWGEDLPATWDKALSVLVSKLRALLSEHGIDGASSLTAAFGCYRLELPSDTWVDVIAATRAAQEAEAALAAGEFEAAKASAALAESLTQQPFLPGDDGIWVDAKRRELDDVRARALSVLADASLEAGDARAAAKWAERAIALEPFRESGYRRLIEAEVAAGNRAEALRVYERCRRLLAEELGTYPSPETESIYRGLLEAPAPPPAQAPVETQVPVEPAPERAAPRRSPSRTQAAVAAVLVAMATATGILATRGGQARATVAPDSVVALDSSGSIDATVPVGARPVALAAGAGALWVANLDDKSVTRIDLSSERAVRTIPVSRTPTALAATRAELWIADGAEGISRIDPSYDQVTSTTLPTGRVGGCCFYPASAPRPMLAAFGSIWVADHTGYLWRLDLRSGKRTASVDVGNDPSAIAAGAGSVWVANRTDGTVTRIDPDTLVTTTIPVGHSPAAVAVDAAGAWVANAGDDDVVRVDADTNAVAETTRVGVRPTAVLPMAGAVWAANGGDGTVMRIDRRTGKVTKTVQLGGTPDALAAAGGKVWVAVAPAPPRAAPAGGVAHLTSQYDVAPLDPALDIGDFIPYATCANLVAYPDKPAPEGSRIVPEVAEAIPTPTAGGTTYSFTIRPGFRFSPPSNEPVTAASFKRAIERDASPRLKSPMARSFEGVVGYRAYAAGKARDLAGGRPRAYADDQAVAA